MPRHVALIRITQNKWFLARILRATRGKQHRGTHRAQHHIKVSWSNTAFFALFARHSVVWSICKGDSPGIYRVGQIKRGQCSFFRRKARFRELIIFGRWNNSSFTHFETPEIKYFSPEGATKANDFLCSSILPVLLRLAHNFYIKTILLTNNFYGKHCLILLVFIC